MAEAYVRRGIEFYVGAIRWPLIDSSAGGNFRKLRYLTLGFFFIRILLFRVLY